MFLIYPKQKIRAIRHQKLNWKPVNWNKKFLFFKKKHSYRHNFYQKTFNTPAPITSKFKYTHDFYKTFYYCISFFSLKKRYVGLYRSNSGIYAIQPLIDSIALGDKISFYRNASRFYYSVYVGSLLPLKFCKLTFIISNIGLTSPKWAVSFGTYCRVLNILKYYILVQLPSGVSKLITKSGFSLIGRNAGIKTNKQYFGKWSTKNSYSKKIIVRSCAKNPVDHPNGGRTRGKMTFKTPWGLVAKSNK